MLSANKHQKLALSYQPGLSFSRFHLLAVIPYHQPQVFFDKFCKPPSAAELTYCQLALEALLSYSAKNVRPDVLASGFNISRDSNNSTIWLVHPGVSLCMC